MAGQDEQLGQIHMNSEAMRGDMLQLHAAIRELHAASKETTAAVASIRGDLIELKTYAKVASAAALVAIAVIGWNAREAYRLNGGVEKLTGMTNGIAQMQADVREVRGSLTEIGSDIKAIQAQVSSAPDADNKPARRR